MDDFNQLEPGKVYLYEDKQLTKREKFAMAAMQGIISKTSMVSSEVIAMAALDAADALLKELAK